MSDLFSALLDETCLLLETYKGRDKVLRTLCYLSKLLGELQKDPALAQKFSIVSSQMSATRATLRLFDDIPMLKYSLQYGLGKGEPDKYMANLGLASNIIDHLFLPIEKMSWLAKYKLITGINNNKWDTASSMCWVLSTYLTILKTFRYLFIMEKHKGCVVKDQSITNEKLNNMQKFHILTLMRLCMDFIHAVNTLPPGFLWSSKLKTLHIGIIGTSSSILGIYLIVYKRWLK